MFLRLVFLILFVCGCSTVNKSESDEVNIYRRIIISHPTDSQEKVEFYAKNSCYKRPKKTVIFLHGHQEIRVGGKAYLDWGELDRWEQKGYLAVAVSLPGYGGSSGKSDFSGPYSQDAVEGGINFLLNKGWADPKHINLVGVSRGGIVAGRVAARRDDIKKLVLISTSYDLEKTYQRTRDPQLKKIMESEMTMNQEEMAKRSLQADKISADLLILHGKNDQKVHYSQAKRFFQARVNLRKNENFLRLFESGHNVPLKQRQPIINAFLEED